MVAEEWCQRRRHGRKRSLRAHSILCHLRNKIRPRITRRGNRIATSPVSKGVFEGVFGISEWVFSPWVARVAVVLRTDVEPTARIVLARVLRHARWCSTSS